MCFNTRTLHCKEIENLVFGILLPKSKPVTIGVFYKPPNQADFMDLMVVILTLISYKTAIINGKKALPPISPYFDKQIRNFVKLTLFN